MASYIVKFVEDMPSQGPSEVAYAEVLPSGWVMVMWREVMPSVYYYPPQVIISVQTPGTNGEVPSEDQATPPTES